MILLVEIVIIVEAAQLEECESVIPLHVFGLRNAIPKYPSRMPILVDQLVVVIRSNFMISEEKVEKQIIKSSICVHIMKENIHNPCTCRDYV